MKHDLTARALAAFASTALLAAAASVALAQAPPPGAPEGGPEITMLMPQGDAEFVRAIAATNISELVQAKYVVNRTADPAVRAFAQQMIDDHSTAAVKLQATTRGSALLPAPRAEAVNPMGLASIAMLRDDSGAALDRDYMRMQVPAHRMALHIAEWEVDHGQSPGLRAFADNLVPVIRQHLQIANAYLADHHLTPYEAPRPNPVPGNVAPNGAPRGPGTVNNPAAPGGNGGSTQGQNNAGGGTMPNAPPPSPSPHP